ncbi:MAG: glucosamine-6-phosphate deaminase [Bacillaceae bacterium]
MNIIVVKNEQELAQKAYDIIANMIEQKPNGVLGCATGGSPVGIYELMRKNKPNTSGITTVNLDEYINLDFANPKSYHYYMNEELFAHLPFKANYLPNGMKENAEEACADYEKVLEAHPVDLQLLGIGENAHIAFNEPGTSFESTTHVIELTESTRQANRRYFEREEDVPTHAITMGIKSIMRAKSIVLVASGEKKADAIKAMIEGEITEECPASILQKHNDVTIVVDEAAFSKCEKSKLDVVMA